MVLPGDVAKDARNNNIIANRIARWTAGERMSLWWEGMKLTKADQLPRKARKRAQAATDDEAEEERAQDRKRGEVISLACRGLPGKAVQHAYSMGLAPDTAATIETMRSKFVAPPPTQYVTASGTNVKRRHRGGLEGSHQFFQCRSLCGSEWPASRLWRQASRSTAPGFLQPAGCREATRRSEGLHWESERHCSLQEGERWLGRCLRSESPRAWRRWLM